MLREIACGALMALFILAVPRQSQAVGQANASGIAEQPAERMATSRDENGRSLPALTQKRWRSAVPTRHHRDPELSPRERSTYPRKARIDLQWVELRNLPDAELASRVNTLLRQRAGHQGSAEATTDGRSLDVSSEVKSAFAGRQLLSVAYDVDTYGHGAATSNSRVEVLNYDLRSKRELNFDDLFPPAVRPTLDRLIADRLDRMQIDHSFNGLERANCFYFDQRSLTICFDRRDIAGSAVGNIHVRLPLARLAPLLARNDVARRLVSEVSAASGSTRSGRTPPPSPP